MANSYNRIILIGNGFDKAMGLKTDYADFILSYFKKFTQIAINLPTYGDELMSFKRINKIFDLSADSVKEKIKDFSTLKDLKDWVNRYFSISYKFTFFEDIVTIVDKNRWVDIEQFYYDTLIKEFHKIDIKNRNHIVTEIKKLHDCMEELTNVLYCYIRDVQNSKIIDHTNHSLNRFFQKISSPLDEQRRSLVTRHNRDSKPTNIIFIDFNYTNTTRKLIGYYSTINAKIIHIHGEIEDEKNEIIFGYGDDTENEYEKLELANENEFLRMIKSFQYPRTHNYHNLLSIIENNEFDVFIIGHSCGLSDRTLLKTIFEHKNCMAIQNFHYKGESEDFAKRMEISRHFTDKVKMRERVLPFDENATIPQLL